MRIVYFTESLPPNTDGVERTLVHLVETLETEDVDYKFYSPFKPDDNHRWSWRVRKILSIPFIFYTDYKLAIPYFHGLKAEIDKFNPDIVHVVSPTLLGIYGLQYAKKRNIKSVSSYHTHFVSYLSYYGFSKMFEEIGWQYLRWFYNQFDKTYAPSPSAVKELRSRNINNVELWQRGIKLDKFSPDFRNIEFRKSIEAENKTVLLYVGRLVKEKDLDDLIDANNILEKKGYDFRLVIVGDGPMREELHHKLPGAVLTGYKHGKELSEIYASADLFVFPSSTETFGNVVLEAFASGLPAVAVNKGGVADIINHGLDGFVAQPNSPKDFAWHIEIFLNNYDTLKRMGNIARETAKKYSWDTVNRRLLNSYENVILNAN